MIFRKDFLKGLKENVILIETDSSEKHILYAEGDCCSESWFEDLVVGELGGTIEDITKSDSVEVPATRQECDLKYDCEIKTTKGSTAFKLINSSNGYYSGDIRYAGIYNGTLKSWMI